MNNQAKKKTHFMYSSAVEPALANRKLEEKQKLLIDDIRAGIILEEKTGENDSFERENSALPGELQEG
jgi:hypothetical protein